MPVVNLPIDIINWRTRLARTRVPLAGRHAFKLICVLVMAVFLSSDGLARWRTSPAQPLMPPPPKSGFAPVNGISMYYAIYGQGSPVLLIHGGMGSADTWAAIIPALAARHEVIVADSRGHGRSTRTVEPLSYGEMARDYLALLDYLHIRKVALVGWSDGAIIGLDLAIHHPERLRVLFAQAANADPGGLRGQPTASDKACAGITDAMAEYRRLSATPGAFIGFCKDVFEMWATQPHYAREQLASITVPTAIVTGDHDMVVRRDHSDYLARTIPGARRVILRDLGHEAVWQDPGTYLQAVLDVIDGDTLPAATARSMAQANPGQP